MASEIITSSEKKELFNQIYLLVGAPELPVELTDEVMTALLKKAIEDYSEYVLNWLTLQQWSSIYGVNIDAPDFAFYLMHRSLDFEKQFTYAYSKQTGTASNSPWELKKDFIELIPETQTYTIPAGREVNEVLWEERPTIDRARLLALNSLDFSASALGWSVNGAPAAPVNYLYNVISASQDLKMRDRMRRGDVMHKLTAGPNGTKLLTLYPVPGGRHDSAGFGDRLWANLFKGGGLAPNTRVWYFYYDVGSGMKNKCLKDNPDVVLLPSDAPLKNLTWKRLNDPTRNWVRRYLLALAKERIGLSIGFYSGKIKIPDNEIDLNYAMFFEQAKTEKEKLMEELRVRLEALEPWNIMKKRADLADDLNRVLKHIPMSIYTR